MIISTFFPSDFARTSFPPFIKDTPPPVSLIGIKSGLKADSVYEYIKEYYAQGKSVVRLLGMIFCLEWKEIIVFDYRNNKYKMLLLNNFDLGISSFFNHLLYEVYGTEVYLSATNTIGPSLFIPIKSCELRPIE